MTYYTVIPSTGWEYSQGRRHKFEGGVVNAFEGGGGGGQYSEHTQI